MAPLSIGGAWRGFGIGCLVAGAVALGYSQLRGADREGVAVASAEAALPSVAAARANRVSALGRLEPEDGVIQIAGPSAPSVVIAKIYVDDGDRIAKGQLLATIDTADVLEAAVQRLEAECDNARRERDRTMQLFREHATSDSRRDNWEMRVRVAEAQLAGARAELANAHVYSPIAGQVLKVHAREGERVGPQGIVELGKTDHMFAIAEVYEEDVSRVRVGQRAVMTSPALPAPLVGKVDRIHLAVAKQDALGNDPAARKDARVVEVEVRLDDSRAAAALTNLQVDVQIEP
jgi:HlyD family secretion protein